MSDTTTSGAATITAAPFDVEKAHQFVGKVVTDCAAAVSLTLAVIGDQLGLYRALADGGSATSAELAERAHVSERYTREWLINQASAGYLAYDPQAGRYALPAEQAVALLDQDSPFYVGGALMIALAMTKAEPRIRESFQSGAGMGWGEHDPYMWEGCERLFRPGYLANLVQSWIPALDGVQEKLERGATMADIGCGLGASTIILAKAFPNSRFFGFDAHPASIERATADAQAAGVADRVTFAVATGVNYPGEGYDLVAYFDCLHDMGDPVAAARYIRSAMAADGSWLIVEPMAADTIEGNLNPVGRVYYNFSTLLCLPNARSQGSAEGTGGAMLGAQAGEAAIRSVVLSAGFSSFRQAAQTPFNLVYEAKP